MRPRTAPSTEGLAFPKPEPKRKAEGQKGVKARVDWSSVEAYVRDHWQECTGREMARALGVDENTVYRTYKRLGIVKNRLHRTVESRFWIKVLRPSDGECWEWTGPKERYGKFKIANRHVAAHRYSWQVQNGEIPAGMHVCHRCDNTLCVNPAHLFLGTHAENMADMAAKGRANLEPARAKQRKVTPEVLRAVRGAGELQRQIGTAFGLTQAHVSKLVREVASPRKGIKSVNRTRRARLRATAFAKQAQACYTLPCYGCAREGCSVPHHEPPRSVGGTDADALPLCDLTRMNGKPGCHQRRHNQGPVTFWKKLGFSPEEAKENTRIQAGLLPPPMIE